MNAARLYIGRRTGVRLLSYLSSSSETVYTREQQHLVSGRPVEVGLMGGPPSLGKELARSPRVGLVAGTFVFPRTRPSSGKYALQSTRS
jgi:hypothetical protein